MPDARVPFDPIHCPICAMVQRPDFDDGWGVICGHCGATLYLDAKGCATRHRHECVGLTGVHAEAR